MSLAEHLEKLRHFNKLADYKSINEAARAIGMSQAGLSKSLAGLEEVLGVPLFIRSNAGLLLTNEGQIVLSASQKILQEANQVDVLLRSIKAPTKPKQLRIGMYDSIAVYMFSDLVKYVEKIYESVNLNLLVDTSTNLSEAIVQNRVDFAIGANFGRKKTIHADFFPLFDDYYSFYYSTKIESPQISKEPLLIHPDAEDGEGVKVESHLSALLRSRCVYKIHNFETIKTLTLQGLGIGVLPTQVARPLVEQKQLKNIEIPRMKSQFGRHEIDILVTKNFVKAHADFTHDLYRLGQYWTKF